MPDALEYSHPRLLGYFFGDGPVLHVNGGNANHRSMVVLQQEGKRILIATAQRTD
jgi:hypothetical protein